MDTQDTQTHRHTDTHEMEYIRDFGSLLLKFDDNSQQTIGPQVELLFVCCHQTQLFQVSKHERHAQFRIVTHFLLRLKVLSREREREKITEIGTMKTLPIEFAGDDLEEPTTPIHLTFGQGIDVRKQRKEEHA
jgi:hypothetical protein